MRYIIVKYASDWFPSGKAPIGASCYPSYTARKRGIVKVWAKSKSEAEADLLVMEEINPGVGYGVVEVDENAS